MNNGFNSGSLKTAMFADCLANSKEIFQLIDQIFPLDSCRHYEVLPLKLDGNYLVLGMLDPNNEESKNFANSIAKVFKYDLEPMSMVCFKPKTPKPEVTKLSSSLVANKSSSDSSTSFPIKSIFELPKIPKIEKLPNLPLPKSTLNDKSL